MYKHYLTAMVMFKDDAIYLKEWLDFHILMGFQHFYMYDNNSIDNPLKILAPYIKKNLVTYNVWDKDLGTFPDCNPHRMYHIKKYGHLSRWIGFFDIDEFIYPVKSGENLHDILSEFEQFSGIQIHFLVFGSNGKEVYEDDPVIARFNKRASFNKTNDSKFCKTIVNPTKVLSCKNSHFFIFKDGFAVNDIKISENDKKYNYDFSRIAINHYVTKSKEEYLNFKVKCKNDVYRVNEKRYLRSLKLLNEITDNNIKNRYLPYLLNDFVLKNINEISVFYSDKSTRHNFNIEEYLKCLYGTNKDCVTQPIKNIIGTKVTRRCR